MHDRVKIESPAKAGIVKTIRDTAERLRRWWLSVSLPAKLLLLTAMFVMLAEVLIFLPSISTYRIGWLNDRLTAAYVSALAADAVPGGNVPPQLRNELLRTALVRAIAIRREGQRRLVIPPVTEITIDSHYDIRDQSTIIGGSPSMSTRLSQIKDALAVFFAADDRNIRVVGLLGPRYDDIIEVVMPEYKLREAMVDYALNILWVSIIISLLTAALVYFSLSRLLVRPMMRLTHNMINFAEHPEDASRIIVPSGRTDEIGAAERELAQMQRQLAQSLKQKDRLAQLGLAVSKISHDLRNMLANAQLISDRLTTVPDPTVQRFAPKLIASLDRAINFCNDSLKFGRAGEEEPRRELIALKPIVQEAGDGLGLPREGTIGWKIEMEDTLQIDADHEHLFRVLSNLVRNAVQAIETQSDHAKGLVKVKAWRDGRRVFVEVSDDGPGVPKAARANLFRAFQGARKGGTGLGLVVAAELVAAHGGALRLADRPGKGATFVIEMPDRGTDRIRVPTADPSPDLHDGDDD